LEFDYDKTLFSIDKPTLDKKTKTNLINAGTVTITCLKDLDSNKEINIYAYPKGSTKLSEAEQKKIRCLAGRMVILQNDDKARQTQKFVLVSVITKGVGKTNISFEGQEKTNLYNVLYQFLTIPIVEYAMLDLSNNTSFQMGGKYIDSTGNLIAFDNSGTIKSTFDAMKNIFLNNLANETYKSGNYFRHCFRKCVKLIKLNNVFFIFVE